MTKEDGTAELGRDELRALLNAAEAWRDELDGLLDPEREAEADELGELIQKVKRDNDMEVDDDVDYVEFDSKFHTIQNPDDPTEGDHLTFEQTAPYPINRVWTVVEGDDGGTWWACPGTRVVNRLFYLVTEEEWHSADTDINYRYA